MKNNFWETHSTFDVGVKLIIGWKNKVLRLIISKKPQQTFLVQLPIPLSTRCGISAPFENVGEMNK